MLHFVFGRSGAGKSEWMAQHLSRTAQTGHVFLLVPDREAVGAESRVSELSGAGNVDVVTFRRLCNYVFRRYGGLCTEYIEPGAKKLIMRNVLRALAPTLHAYGNLAGQSRGIAEALCAARTECYQNKITPAALTHAAESLDETDPLREKVSDLGLLFAAFDAEVATRFADPDGMLGRAAEALAGGEFFHGTTVYIDSFLSFSAQQYDILREILLGANEVYLSLAFLPDEDADASSVYCLKDTERRIRRLAERAGIPCGEAVSLRQETRYQNDELAYLAAQIAGTEGVRPAWDGVPQSVSLLRAANLFAEAEAVATDICRRVREGARYRDIAVIVRDVSRAEGVTDAVFRKYGIPTFLSAKKEIREKPLIRYLFSMISVCERGFRAEDVIALMKTGMSDLSPDECDLFENYMIKWKLRGRRFTDDTPWTMNPRGYEPLTAADAATLETLAELRERLIPPLVQFSGAFRAAKTVREKATVLYDALTEREIPQKLHGSAKDAAARGDEAGASETVQLWNVFCGALDQLVSASGDTEADVPEFSGLLSMILADTSIGKIPTSIDEVTIAEASEKFAGTPRFVYLLGANEGVFPRRTEGSGFFSEQEKGQLAAAGIEITNRRDRAISEELFYFDRACALPSEALTVCYTHYDLSGTELRPSIGVKRLRSLFSALTERDYESAAPAELIESRTASFDYVGQFSGELGDALCRYYEADASFAEKMKYRETPLSASADTLTPEEAATIFGTRLRTSYSALETYIECHFAYFCKYELNLQDRDPAQFGAKDIGNFTHEVLEKTVRWLVSEKEQAQDDEALRMQIRESAVSFIENCFRTDYASVTPRMRHLCDGLCRSAEAFAKQMREEFAVSAFVPRDFELTVGAGGEVSPMTLSGEHTEVALRGKIDRVDVYEDADGKLYFRIIDYKTGSKTFDRDKLDLGLDLQMPLYLFSIKENGAARYGKECLPAGVLYRQVRPVQETATFGELSPERKKEACPVSGLLLDDKGVLSAMDPERKGKYIPASPKDLLDAAGFDALERQIKETVLHFADEMKSGAAQAKPLARGQESPCNFCKMRAVCRNANVKRIK